MANLAYILSASHSGSTLLALMLGAQPGAVSTGELKATSLGDANQYRCSCRELIRDCGFWRRVSSRMADAGFPDFDITQARTSIFEVESPYARRLLAPLHRGPALELARDAALLLSKPWRSHLAETQRRNAALIRTILAETGASVVVDSSKLALRLKYLLRNPELDVKVVRTIRDGRAVALTYMDEWNFADASDPALRGGGTGTKKKPVRRNMEEAANEWKRSQEANEALLATLPRSQWIQVRYEDLCAAPEATLRRLNEFIGIDPAQTTTAFRQRQLHVIGNGMRFDTTSEVKLDERWRSHLSQDDLDTFERVAGDLNRKYGYN